MTRTTLRRPLFAAITLPLALGLAACGSEKTDDDGALPTSEPIAAVTPPAGQSWVETAAVTPEDGYRIGNPDAPLKLVEYASNTCSHCADFSKDASGPMDDYVASGRVSYEIRNQIHDPIDLTLAMLMRCGEPAAFHPLATQIWANLGDIITKAQSNQDALAAAMQSQGKDRFQKIAEAAGLLDFFAARGISRDAAMQCLADPAKATAIAERSEKQSEELNVTGTPTFFLNGKRIEGTAWSIVEPALQQAGAR